MTFVPTPIRALIGLAATAVDEIKKLDETLPEAATSVPVATVSFLMQTSMKVQQQIAEYASRGDEVLSRLRGVSDDAPSWATFDDEPAPATDTPPARRAAFDEVELDGLDEDEDEDLAAPADSAEITAAEVVPEPSHGSAKKTTPKPPPAPDLPTVDELIAPVKAAKKVTPKKASAKKPLIEPTD